MRTDNDTFCMDMAKRVAQQSSAARSKVGAIIVRGDNVLALGYNGTPRGWDNCCEHVHDNELVTKPEVLHAESNALAKIARSTQSSKGATLYVTLAPCLECSKLLAQCGILRVVYLDDYRNSDGIDLLDKCGVIVNKYKGD